MKRFTLIGGVFLAALFAAKLVGTGISQVYAQAPAPIVQPAKITADPRDTLYTYRAKATNLARVYDGDTIKDVDVDLGFDVWLRGIELRLLRIDAPEMTKPRGVDETAEQRARRSIAAVAARDALQALIDQDGDGQPDERGFLIRSVERDSFGRCLAEVWVEIPGGGMVNASDYLLREGHAQPYAK